MEIVEHDLEKANLGIQACAFCYFARSKVHQEIGDERAAINHLETLVTPVDLGTLIDVQDGGTIPPKRLRDS